jgi:hypothetical protein
MNRSERIEALVDEGGMTAEEADAMLIDMGDEEDDDAASS